eukprot:g1302.t1
MPAFVLDQLYIVLEKPPGEQRRPLLLCRGSGRCTRGWLAVEQQISLRDLPDLLRTLHERFVEPEYLGELSELPQGSPFAQPTSAILAGAERACELVRGERVLGALVKACATFDWLVDEEADTYFELRTKSPLADPVGVEAAALKIYLQEAAMTVIYFESTYYIKVADGAASEQKLTDMDFADVSQPSACYYIPTMVRRAGKLVDEEEGVAKFVLNLLPPKDIAQGGWLAEGEGAGWLPEGWGSDNGSDGGSSDGSGGGNKTSSTSARSPAGPKNQQGDLRHDVLAKAKDVSIGAADEDNAHVQLYCILLVNPFATEERGGKGKGEAREAMCRFGVADAPLVVQSLQRQQSCMNFDCLDTEMPASSPFAQPLAQFALMTRIVKDQLLSRQQQLEELLSAKRKRRRSGGKDRDRERRPAAANSQAEAKETKESKATEMMVAKQEKGHDGARGVGLTYGASTEATSSDFKQEERGVREEDGEEDDDDTIDAFFEFSTSFNFGDMAFVGVETLISAAILTSGVALC